MKVLLFVLFAFVVAHHAMHRKPAHRTAGEAKAWADWFAAHPNGGGV